MSSSGQCCGWSRATRSASSSPSRPRPRSRSRCSSRRQRRAVATVMAGTRSTVQLGTMLHVVCVTARGTALAPGTKYVYDVKLGAARQRSVEAPAPPPVHPGVVGAGERRAAAAHLPAPGTAAAELRVAARDRRRPADPARLLPQAARRGRGRARIGDDIVASAIPAPTSGRTSCSSPATRSTPTTSPCRCSTCCRTPPRRSASRSSSCREGRRQDRAATAARRAREEVLEEDAGLHLRRARQPPDDVRRLRADVRLRVERRAVARPRGRCRASRTRSTTAARRVGGRLGARLPRTSRLAAASARGSPARSPSRSSRSSDFRRRCGRCGGCWPTCRR